MRLVQLLEPDSLYRFEEADQTRLQSRRKRQDFGINGIVGFHSPAHIRYIAHPL